MALELDIERVVFPSGDSFLADTQMSIEPGESLAILGGSGSGKSLLVTILAGLHPEPLGGRVTGAVRLDGKSIKEYAPTELLARVGYLGSQPKLFLTGFCNSVQEEIAWSLLAMGLSIFEVEGRVTELLSQLGMSELSASHPAELSGGEQQMVALACVLARQPDYILLDQPVDNLDIFAQARFSEALRQKREESKLAVVWASSQMESAVAFDKWAFLPSDPTVGGVCTQRFETDLVPREVLRKDGDGEDSIDGPISEIPQNSLLEHAQLKAQNLSYRHLGAPRDTLSSVDLSFQSPGDGLVGLFGKNGAGKSSLLRLLQGLVAPSSGLVTLDERDLETINISTLVEQLSHCFQDTGSMFFRARVDSELLAIGETLGKSEASANCRLEEALALFELTEVRSHHPQTLSASKSALLGLACSWYTGARFHFLDEPTAKLDRPALRILDRALAELVRAGSTIIVVSHDLTWLEQRCHRLVGLSRGQVVIDARRQGTWSLLDLFAKLEQE